MKTHSRPLPIVAIDGPAGAGKSTVARILAHQFKFTLIDTGALYRALSLAAIEKDVSLSDGPALGLLAEHLKIQFGQLEMGPDHIPKQKVYLNGMDVTESIRSPEMGMAASTVSKLPEVRNALLGLQREMGAQGGIVMEGRDIGTVIFPDAELKFYLSATDESRARRRCDELKAAGIDISYEQVLKETRARDDQDMNRAIAPLKQAADARLIDSTKRSLDEVVSDMAHEIRAHLKNS